MYRVDQKTEKSKSWHFRIFLIFRLRNDLYCVEWGVKLYLLTHSEFLLNRAVNQSMKINFYTI